MCKSEEWVPEQNAIQLKQRSNKDKSHVVFIGFLKTP